MAEEKTETRPSKRALNIMAAATILAEMGDTKAIDADLRGRNIVLARNTSRKDRAEALIKSEGVTTQGHFAALVINYTHGEGMELDADDLTRALAEAFPGAGVGKRHGPHYLCHARKGRLKGLREGLAPIPFRRRQKKESSDDIPDAGGEVTVEALCENDRETLQEMAKSLGVKAGGKNEKIAQRIVDAMTEAAA